MEKQQIYIYTTRLSECHHIKVIYHIFRRKLCRNNEAHKKKTSWSSTLKRSEFVLKINENSNYEDMKNYLVTVEMLLCQMDQLFFLFNTFSKMMRSQFIWKTSRYFCFIFSQGDGNKIDFCLIQKNILNVVDQMSWFIFMENWICFYKLY